MREVARACVLLVGAYGWCLLLHLGCGPSQEAKEAAADSAYAAEHLRCVDQFDTKAQIDACRHAVRIRWGVAETVTDGGRHD